MEWTQEHIDIIRHLFPRQRGNVEIDYLQFFQALHDLAKNGGTWRDLPDKFGNWNSTFIGNGYNRQHHFVIAVMFCRQRLGISP